MQELRHQLARLESVEAEWLEFLAKGRGEARLARWAIHNEVHEVGYTVGEPAKQGAEIDRIATRRDRIGLGAHIGVVVGVVLPDDLDDDADADSQRVPAAKHVADELLDARLGHELAGEFVGANALLLVLRGVRRDGDDGFDEVAGSGLHDPAVFGVQA